MSYDKMEIGKTYYIEEYERSFYIEDMSYLSANIIFDDFGDTFRLYRKWDGCSHLSDLEYMHYDDNFDIEITFKIANHICDLAMYKENLTDVDNGHGPSWKPNNYSQFLYPVEEIVFNEVEMTEDIKKFIEKHKGGN